MRRAYIELHGAVLLAGFTAVLGELITLSALPLVWWRVLLASISFLPIYWMSKGGFRLTPKLTWRLCGVGAVVALHWVTFYGSIKLANASIAVLCIALVSLFTALIEPYLLGKRIDWIEVALGALVVPGMALVVGVIRADYYVGLAVGVLSAFLAALFAVLNKRYVDEAPATAIAQVEMAGAWAFLTLTYPLLMQFDMGTSGFWPTATDWPYLLVLVLGCTTLAFLLQMRSLRHLSAFTSNLAYGLEPVYGILLAVLLLRQDRELHPGFYLGATLIVGALVAHPLLRRRQRRRLARTVAR